MAQRAKKGQAMKATVIGGVDTRAIEKAVRDEYTANKEAWDSICGIGKPFPSIFDLIDVKEKALKVEAVAQIGLARSALGSLRTKQTVKLCEEGMKIKVADYTQDEDGYITVYVPDVTLEAVEAYLEAKNA